MRRCAPAICTVLVMALSACSAGIVPHTYTVTWAPQELRPFEGKRAKLMMELSPSDYTAEYAGMRLPGGGRALYKVGGALAASYQEAFGAFFDMRVDVKYATYLAPVDMDALDLRMDCALAPDRGTAVVKARMRHRIPIALTFDRIVEEIVDLDIGIERELPYGGDEALAQAAAGVLQELFAEAEAETLGQLRTTWREGKYLIDE